MSLDFAEVEAFAQELDDAGAKVVLAARQIVKKGAGNVKDQLRREASGREHAPGLPRAITYDVELKGDEIVAEIGPEKSERGDRRGGSLAFYWLGNSKIGPSLPDPILAADKEAEAMAEWLVKVGVESVGG